MTITATNLAAHELIGLKITISASPDPKMIGVEGIVRDETRNTLTIQARDRLLTIPKRGSILTFNLPAGNHAAIEGSRIQFRPEDRIKRGLAKW